MSGSSIARRRLLHLAARDKRQRGCDVSFLGSSSSSSSSRLIGSIAGRPERPAYRSRTPAGQANAATSAWLSSPASIALQSSLRCLCVRTKSTHTSSYEATPAASVKSRGSDRRTRRGSHHEPDRNVASRSAGPGGEHPLQRPPGQNAPPPPPPLQQFTAAEPPPRHHGAPRLIRYPPPEAAVPPPPPAAHPSNVFTYARAPSSRLFSFYNAVTATSATSRRSRGRSSVYYQPPHPLSATESSGPSSSPSSQPTGAVGSEAEQTPYSRQPPDDHPSHQNGTMSSASSGASSSLADAGSQLRNRGGTAAEATHDHNAHDGHAHGWFGHSHSHAHGAEGSAEDADKLLAALKGKGALRAILGDRVHMMMELMHVTIASHPTYPSFPSSSRGPKAIVAAISLSSV